MPADVDPSGIELAGKLLTFLHGHSRGTRQGLANCPSGDLIAFMNSRQETPSEWQGEARRIKLHGPEEFAAMRKAGRLAAETLDFITPHVRDGVATIELDKLCHDFIVEHEAIPAPLNYRGFPKSICTSINHVVCHGIPGDRKLADGDIVNIDVTVILDGWHGDTSRMFYVGKPSVKAQRLVDATYRAMMAGIEMVKPGVQLGDIGHAIQQLAEGERFSVVRDFCGHGIGRVFHDAPSVLHFGRAGTGPALRARHVLHHRTDGQCRPFRSEGAGRWLDGRHPRPLPFRPVRAHGRRDRGGSRSSPDPPWVSIPALLTHPARAEGRAAGEAALPWPPAAPPRQAAGEGPRGPRRLRAARAAAGARPSRASTSSRWPRR